MSEGLPSNWYQKGDDPEPEPTVERNDRKRFWLAVDQEDVITFLDDDPFRIWEHDAKVGEYWGNLFTCIAGLGHGFDPCPGCHYKPRRLRPKRGRVGFLTIVSEREFEFENRKIKNLKRLFPMKGDLLKTFIKYKKECEGSLIGMRVRVWRTGPRSFKVGDDWMIKGRIEGVTPGMDPAEARKIISIHYEHKDREDIPLIYEPYDYVKMLAPQSRKQVLSLIGTAGEGTGAGSDSGFSSSDSASFGSNETVAETTGTEGGPTGQQIDF